MGKLERLVGAGVTEIPRVPGGLPRLIAKTQRVSPKRGPGRDDFRRRLSFSDRRGDVEFQCPAETVEIEQDRMGHALKRRGGEPERANASRVAHAMREHNQPLVMGQREPGELLHRVDLDIAEGPLGSERGTFGLGG